MLDKDGIGSVICSIERTHYHIKRYSQIDTRGYKEERQPQVQQEEDFRGRTSRSETINCSANCMACQGPTEIKESVGVTSTSWRVKDG